MVLRVLQTGGGEACTNQCGWMRETERCSWVRKAKRSGLAGRSRGLAGRRRQRSFVERQRFWVFPLQPCRIFKALMGRLPCEAQTICSRCQGWALGLILCVLIVRFALCFSPDFWLLCSYSALLCLVIFYYFLQLVGSYCHLCLIFALVSPT